MKTFYIYAMLENLISLVLTGQMPHNALNKTIDLYQEATQCTSFPPSAAGSTFVIELIIPQDAYTDPLNFTSIYHKNVLEKIQTQQINTRWVTNIYAYNKTGRNLALQCFDTSEVPVGITIKQELFPKYHALILPESSCAINGKTDIINARFINEENLLNSQMQTLVNTVNCVGVMGKGIAKSFKERFPEMFEDYKARCKAGKVVLGKLYLVSDR